MNSNQEYTTTKTTNEHVRESTAVNYMICMAPGCYKNCCYDCDSALFDIYCDAFNSVGMCSCGHHCRQHGRYRLKWVLKHGTNTSVNNRMKSRFEQAQKQYTDLIAKSNKMDRQVQDITSRLTRIKKITLDHCTEFQDLSLSGAFSNHIEFTIQFAQDRSGKVADLSVGLDADYQRELDSTIGRLEKQLEVFHRL